MTDPIKQRIQELCPDVMELKFGCEVRFANIPYTLISGPSSVYPTRGHWFATSGSPDEIRHQGSQIKVEECEILGSPITLAVVLRALGTNKSNFKFYQSIDMDEYWCFSDFHTMARWNLTKNYDDQTQETKDFIGKLLGV